MHQEDPFPVEAGFSMVGLFPSRSEDVMPNMRCIRQILMLSCTYQPLGVMAARRAAGLNNFRVTRLTHRSVFWLRRKRNRLEVEMMARKKQGSEATAPSSGCGTAGFSCRAACPHASDLSDLARCFGRRVVTLTVGSPSYST